MTRTDFKTRLASHFENPVYYSSGDLDASTQDGYDEVVALTGCVFKSATIAVVKDLTYYDVLSLVPDCIGIVSIFNNVLKQWLIPQNLRTWEVEDIEWDTKYGNPEYFSVISHRYFALNRKPQVDDYGNLFVYYKAAAGAEETFLIPDEHIDALENYCITDLWEQNQEWGKAGRQFIEYLQSLEDLRTYIQRRFTQRIPQLRD